MSFPQEITFPRGGTKKRSKLKQVKNEDLFEVSSEVPNKQPRKKRKKGVSQTIIETEEPEIAIEHLTFQNLSNGMLILGCIANISDSRIKMSLPGCLHGHVEITNISDPYTELLKTYAENTDNVEDNISTIRAHYQVGQVFPCRVIAIEENLFKKRFIKLSINPRDINEELRISSIYNEMIIYSAVKSIEDHGYVMDVGIKGVYAFLSLKEAASFIKEHNKGRNLEIGQVIPSAVNMPNLLGKNCATGQVITLTTLSRFFSNAKMKESTNISLGSFLPGSTVDTVIEKVNNNGLAVQCFGFPGCIHKNYVKDMQNFSNCSVFQEVTASVLFVHPVTRIIHLTLLPKLTTNKVSKLFEGLKKWDIVEKAVITSVQKNFLQLKLKENVKGMAMKRELSDKPIKEMEGEGDKFPIGSFVRCRVIGLNYLDNIVSVSLKESILNKTYVNFEELKVGDIYKGTVKRLVPRSRNSNGGMVVSLSPGVQGFVQHMHMADVPLTKPEKMFPSGTVVKCRIMHIDFSDSPPSMLLTCKKGFIQSKVPILSSYEEATNDFVTIGVIVKITDNWMVLSFFNKVQGLVPGSQFGSYKIMHPEKVFFVGQIVKCRVMNCAPEMQRLTLSLKVDCHKAFGDKDMSSPKYVVGKIVEVIVKAKSENGMDVKLVDTKFQAFLPVNHLSDHLENCKMLLQSYKVKDTIRVVCFSSKGLAIVSKKPSLLRAAENNLVLQNISDYEVGRIFPCVVKNFASYGMFVELGYNITGLVPTKFMVDRRISRPDEVNYIYQQSLSAKVMKVEPDRNRIELSTKMSDVYFRDPRDSLDLIQNYFEDMNMLYEHYFTSENPKLELAKLVVGSVVIAKITNFTEHGANCELIGGVKGFVSKHHYSGKKLEENMECSAVVLFANLQDNCVELSFSNHLVLNISRKKEEGSSKVKINQVIKCEVLLIKKEFILVSLGGHAVGSLAYLPTKRCANDFVERDSLYTIGQHYHLVVKRILCFPTSSIILGVLKQHNREAFTSEAETGNCKQKILDTHVFRKKRKFSEELETEKLSKCDIKENKAMSSGEQQHDIKKTSKNEIQTISLHGNLQTEKCLGMNENHSNCVNSEPENKEVDDLCQQNELNVIHELQVGKKYPAVIKSVKNLQMDILIKRRIPGRIHITEILSDASEDAKPFSGYVADQAIKVWVIGFHTKKSHNFLPLSHAQMKTYAECSLLKQAPIPLDKCFSVGEKVTGFIKEFDLKTLSVSLSPEIIGHFELLNLNYSCQTLRKIKKIFSIGKVIKGTILSIDKEIKLTQLDAWKPEKGMLVNGFAQIASADRGLSVKLPHDYEGNVHITDLQDSYVSADMILFDNLKRSFKQFFVLDADHNARSCVLSMRSSRFYNMSTKIQDQEMSSEDLYPGLILRGFVKCITTNCIVVSLGRDLDGLIDVPGLPPNIKNNTENIFSIGDVIGTKVLENQNGRIELSLAEDFKPVSKQQKVKRIKHTSALNDFVCDKTPVKEDAEKLALEVPEEFCWDVEMTPNCKSCDNAGNDSDSSNEAADCSSKKKSSQKEKEKLDEALLFKTEHLLMDHDREPETVDDYDRLIVASPNDSALWLRYMTFHLEQSEIEKAKGVAERALKTISFREETEKFNIWIAILNLENLYGTPDSLNEVFQRAVQQNEPIKVYNHLTDIYVQSDKVEEAEDLLQMMVKKFRLEKEVWIKFGLFYMKTGKLQLARNMMDRSLKSLNAKMHVDLIAKFAQMEFKYGDVERGKSMFENILRNYSKRTDLWSVYIDLIIKEGDLTLVRNVFEQVITLSLSARKMKFFFKRYLDFEKGHGTNDTVDSVIKKASEYFESDFSSEICEQH